MEVHFDGVRGSYSVPGPLTAAYGGNTSCVYIQSENVDGDAVGIMFDSGMGCIKRGEFLIRDYFHKVRKNLNLCICYTHAHPDHTDGFMFFALNFFNEATLFLIGMKTLGKTAGKIIEAAMTPPRSPFEYATLKSKRKNIVVDDGVLFFVAKDGTYSEKNNPDDVFSVKVLRAYGPSHPQQGAVYYRITELKTGKSVTCVWDIESHVGGDVRVMEFARGTDLLIHDTQYTQEEYANPKSPTQGYGHSTYDMAIENAVGANAKKIACFHYNPKHSDAFLNNLSEGFIKMARSKDVEAFLPKEGDIYYV